MRTPSRFTYLSWTLVLLGTCGHAKANDQMYEPSPAAQSSIQIDGRGFIIKGQRTYISSGSVHYARVPHELWEDRLLRVKRGAFNCVQTYAFWNFNEPRENEFDFTGDKDIGNFLSIAQQVGLYATVRPGPYVCAEWDSGGFPIWLRFKPDVIVRADDPAYLQYNDHWYDKILPIIAAHQINHGGNVIMVQLENEHPKGWGTVDSPYFNHLESKAKELGIEVPTFMSGQHHGPVPRVDNPHTSNLTTPWYSTEFWAGWFDLYGDVSPKKLRDVENGQWSIMACGGAGQNFYMLHGGSNFDTWNDPSGAASYDYGAAIGQAGDLRPIYYRMKRANQLAASFPDILANGSDATADYQDFVSGAKVIGARRSDAGTIVFLENPSSGPGTATFKDGSSLAMRGSEIFPVVQNADIAKGMKIADSDVRTLAVSHNGDTTTIVTYGLPGDKGHLTLATTAPLHLTAKSGAFSTDLTDPRHATVSIQFPQTGPDECMLSDGTQNVRILAISAALAWYTWIIGDEGKQSVVLGPHYVSDFQDNAGTSSLLVERPYGQPGCGQVVIYGANRPAEHLAVAADLSQDKAPAPTLGAWQMSATHEAQPDFNDAAWKASEDPLQMGADGDISAFAWYRAQVQRPSAGDATLKLTATDNVSVFINGHEVPITSQQGSHCQVKASFQAGTNTLAVFTSHDGREKAFSYIGPLTNYYRKGLFDLVTVTDQGQTEPVKNWKMHGGVDPKSADALGWTPPGETGGAPAFYRTTFTSVVPTETGPHPIYRVTYRGLSRGTIWLNGHNLGRYPEKIDIHSLYLPECWLVSGTNTLTLFDEKGQNPAGVQLIMETAASREVIRVDKPCDPSTPIIVPVDASAVDLVKLNAGNFAFGRPATASSSEAGNSPDHATDGDLETRWCARNNKPGNWLQVDLGTARNLGSCEIDWEDRALHYKYEVEGSLDGQAWTHLGDDTTAVPQSPDSPSHVSRLNLAPNSVRYVRVTVKAAQGKDWASICELRCL